jgi:hypothetical protein
MALSWWAAALVSALFVLVAFARCDGLGSRAV